MGMKPKRAKAMPHQKQGVRTIERHGGRALLFDDMGLGKTLQVGWWLKRNPQCRPCIIICPSSLKYNWQRELLLHMGLRGYICESRTPPGRGFDIKPDVYIINYDILTPKWVRWLKRRGVALVLDECQRISNPKSTRTRRVKSIGRDMEYVLGLSGTPLENRPAELFPILNLVQPKVFKSWMKFAWRYCEPKRTPYGWDFKGSRNLPRLHRQLKKHGMIRRRKKDIPELALPPKKRRVVLIDMPGPKRDEYRRIVTNFKQWIRKTHPTKAKKALKAEQLTKVGYLKRFAIQATAARKARWVREWLAGHPGEKLVVFAWHAKMVDLLCKYIPGALRITGKTPPKDRQAAVEMFQYGKPRVIVANMEAGGVGLTLTAARYVLFTELDWRPATHTQCEDRCDRISQTRGVRCIYLVAAATIEEDVVELLHEKQAVVTTTLDGEGYDMDLNILDELYLRLEERYGGTTRQATKNFANSRA